MKVIAEVGDVGIDGITDTIGIRVEGWTRSWPAMAGALVGEYTESKAAIEAGLAIARAGDDRIDQSMTAALAGMVFSLWGQSEQAVSLNREARRVAEETGARIAIANACSCLMYNMEPESLPVPEDEFAAAVQRLDQLAFGFQQPTAKIGHAQLAYVRGDVAAALRFIREAYDRIVSAGMPTLIPRMLLTQARMMLAAQAGSERQKIEESIADALELVERLGLAAYRPHVHRVRAELATAYGDAAAADREMQTARALYEEMGAPVPAAFAADATVAPAAGKY